MAKAPTPPPYKRGDKVVRPKAPPPPPNKQGNSSMTIAHLTNKEISIEEWEKEYKKGTYLINCLNRGIDFNTNFCGFQFTGITIEPDVEIYDDSFRYLLSRIRSFSYSCEFNFTSTHIVQVMRILMDYDKEARQMNTSLRREIEELKKQK